MRVASAIVLAVVVALFTFWWGWVRAPAPATVCEHLVGLTMQEASQGELDPSTQGRLVDATTGQCVQMAADKLKLRGRLGYARWAKCLADAQSVAEAGRC